MENSITQFGIYIKDSNGYTPMTIINNASYPEFKHLAKVLAVERNDDSLELIVYSNKFEGTHFSAQSRKLALAGVNEEVNFKLSPMEKEHMFKLTSTIKVPNGSFIFISWGWDEIFAAFLGNPEKEAFAFFSNVNLKPAYAALQDLETTIQVFHDNTELPELLTTWHQLKKQEKEDADYKYVEEAWQEYQEAEKISLKIRYLEKLQMELYGFLNNHPDSNKLEECKERQAEIAVKLPEYKKMV